MRIFVQMISYRESVVESMRNCIENASNKDNISFGICLQQDEETPPELNHERIKVSRVPWAQSKGPSWAMRHAQSFYRGEEYTMLVDSKTRFMKDWDKELIEALESTGSKKPIITNIPGKYVENDLQQVSYKPVVYQMLENALVWPNPMKNITQITPVNWVSSLFFFTRGTHCIECPYDPDLYYAEIEPNITVRSYTRGYDIFAHHKAVVWKDYNQSKMNWQDDQTWWLKDKLSKERLKNILEGNVNDLEFSLGKERSLKDFEHYSGIDLLKKRINRFAASGQPIPKFENDAQWESLYQKDHTIVAQWDVNEIEKCDDYDYWYFSIEDAQDATLYRYDLRPDREPDLFSFKSNYKKITFKTPSDKVPAKVCVWPVSKSKGWLKKSKFEL